VYQGARPGRKDLAGATNTRQARGSCLEYRLGGGTSKRVKEAAEHSLRTLVLYLLKKQAAPNTGASRRAWKAPIDTTPDFL
jgi:hypothetical protein